MTTANTIIADALGSLGVVGSAANVNGNDLTLALRILNRMLDSWRQQPHMATHSAWIGFTLPANTRTRTIGPSGAQITAARPVSIEVGGYSSDGDNDRPVTIMTRDQYAAIEDKDESSTWPAGVYYEAASPIGTLYFWPVAGSDVTVKLPARVHLTNFADLATDYTLPDGYEAAIVPSLAEKLAPFFERPVPPIVARDAAMARFAIKRANAQVPQLDIVHSRPDGYSGFLSGA